MTFITQAWTTWDPPKWPYLPLSPLYPIPILPTQTTLLPYSRTFRRFLFLIPSSFISFAFIYRHCWLWPAPSANPGRRLKSIPIVALTSLEGFPHAEAMLAICKAEMIDRAPPHWALKLPEIWVPTPFISTDVPQWQSLPQTPFPLPPPYRIVNKRNTFYTQTTLHQQEVHLLKDGYNNENDYYSQQ